MRVRNFYRTALRSWLALACLHSIVLGAIVYLLTGPLLAAQGFDLSGGLFYPRQSGAFLVILGVGYGLAAANPEGRKTLVFLTVFSKAVAVLFLFSEALLRGAPPAALAAGGGDAFLGGIALFLAVMFYREREASR